jgi:hypothetical protein
MEARLIADTRAMPSTMRLVIASRASTRSPSLLSDEIYPHDRIVEGTRWGFQKPSGQELVKSGMDFSHAQKGVKHAPSKTNTTFDQSLTCCRL